MATNNTIIGYANLVKPFGSQDKLLAKTQETAAKIVKDPAQVAATMDDLKAGLDLWREAEVHPQILSTPCHPLASQLQSHVVKEATAADKIESFFMKIADEVLKGFEVKFSNDDWPEWAASFFTWVAGIARADQLKPEGEPKAEGIDENFSLGVLGDFGTGLYGGSQYKTSIDDKYSMMLHLGDVYYSATPEEVQKRFIDCWPFQAAPVSRAMNGNHEMYTGGHTYFGTILPKLGQKSSYFALQNSNWLLAALDTAYSAAIGGKEGVLDDPQMNWLKTIVEAAGDRSVVLFSHHEPFTQLDDNEGGNLITQLEKFGLADKIFAWYWGHEHRCLLYDRHPKYGFYGRCIGHAAFPQERDDLTNAPVSPDFGEQWRRLKQKSGPKGPDDIVPAAWMYDNNNLFVPDPFQTKFGPNGFIRLDFTEKELVERVRTPLNANIWFKGLPRDSKLAAGS